MQQNITNEMLYELLKEFKADVNRRFDDVDRRFDEVDRRFDDVDRRFDEHDKRMDRMEETQKDSHQFLMKQIDRVEDNQKEDHRMIMDIWKAREKVRAQVTWDFIWKAVAVNAVCLFAAGKFFFGG